MKRNDRVILIKTGEEYIITNVIFSKESGKPYLYEISSDELDTVDSVYYSEIMPVEN